MEVARSIREVRDAVRTAGREVALVPTMGALHAGHVSLIEAAKKTKAYIVVSIYVNPTQFGPKEDFGQYPRSFEADAEACRKAGVDLLFAPTDAEMYPPGDETRVRPGLLADTLCGPFRPGHFEGVCTVVAKLFNIVSPQAAFFGQKDAQQAIIIRRMVEDLRMPTRIEVCPTVREPDGLAMSSRNARLSPQDRSRAPCLYKALCKARERLLAGEASIGRILAAMRDVVAEYPEVKVDYLCIVDADTLSIVSAPAGKLLVAGAIRIGGTRLIDNLNVEISKVYP